MSKSYDEIMEHVSVTDEMRSRVLQNVNSQAGAPRPKAVRLPVWRRYAPAAACFVLIIAVLFTVPRMFYMGSSSSSAAYDSSEMASDEAAVEGDTAAVDIQDFDSAEALSEAGGVPIKDLSGLPFTPESAAYTMYWGEIVEIDYSAESGDISYRKSLGTEDPSGYYNEFTYVTFLTVDGTDVTLKGEKQGFYLALWQDGDYACCVSSTTPLDEDTFIAMIESTFDSD